MCGQFLAILDEYAQVEPTAPGIIERRLQLRMQRQQVLRRDPSLSLLVVLDESILQRRIGDESVMYEQLQRLASEADDSKDACGPILQFRARNCRPFSEAY